MRGISQKKAQTTKKEEKYVFEIQEQQEQKDKGWNQLIQYEVQPNSRNQLEPKKDKKSKSCLDIKRLFKDKKEKRKKGKKEKLQSRKRIIFMSLQKLDQDEKNQKRKLSRYVRKIKGACNKDLQIDRRARDNEEENDEDMQLLREEYLLPEGLLQEMDIY